MLTMRFFLLAMSLTAVLFTEQAVCQTDAPLPDKMQAYIRNIHFGKIGDARPAVEYRFVGEDRNAVAPNVPDGGAGSGQAEPSVYHVAVSWNLKDTVQQDDMQITVHPSFPAVFHWAPHLTPTDEHIIAQHVFRAPALIAASGKKTGYYCSGPGYFEAWFSCRMVYGYECPGKYTDPGIG